MAISRVQGTNGHNLDGSTSTIVATAFGSSITAGNAIIVGVMRDGAASTSVTDTFGNKYLKIVDSANLTRRCEIYYCASALAGAANVVTSNGGFNDGVIFAEEWSGLAKIGAYDTQKFGIRIAGAASPLSTGASSVTRTQNELVFVAGEIDISGTTNLTVGAGYSNFATDRSNFIVGAIESAVVSTNAAQTATMVTDATAPSSVIALATFADVSLLPSFRPNNLRPHPFSPGIAR